MEKQKEVLKVLLKHYTKIGRNGGIAKVIFDDEFENIAEEIVKLFAIPVVSKQRELLIAFREWINEDEEMHLYIPEKHIDRFIEGNL